MSDVFEDVHAIIQAHPMFHGRISLIQDLGEVYARRGDATKALALFPLIEEAHNAAPSPFYYGVKKVYNEIEFFIRLAEASQRDSPSHVADKFIHRALRLTDRERDPITKQYLLSMLFEYYLRRHEWGKAEVILTKALIVEKEIPEDSTNQTVRKLDLRLRFTQVLLDNGNVLLAKFKIQELDHEIPAHWTETRRPALARLQAGTGDVVGADESIETVFAARWRRWKAMYPDTFADAQKTVWNRKVIDLCRVVGALVKFGDTVEAEKLFEKTWEIYENDIDPFDLGFPLVRHTVSQAAAALGKWELALTLFSPSSYEDRADTLSALFRSLLKSGFSSKALPLIKTPEDLALFIHIQQDLRVFENDLVGKALLKVEKFNIENSLDFRPIFFAKGVTGKIEEVLVEARTLPSPMSKSYALLGVADALMAGISKGHH